MPEKKARPWRWRVSVIPGRSSYLFAIAWHGMKDVKALQLVLWHRTLTIEWKREAEE
jgi:hypothetical protein